MACAKGLTSTTMTTAALPAGFVRLIVGYDESPPAARALDAAVRLLQGRSGRIDVVYVTHPFGPFISNNFRQIMPNPCRAGRNQQH